MVVDRERLDASVLSAGRSVRLQELVPRAVVDRGTRGPPWRALV